MAYSPYKMKGSEFYGKSKAAPKFLGKMMKSIGGMAKKAVVGSDGKFGIGDVGRMALGPMGMLGGALSYKEKSPTQKKGCKKR
tara:strand:+ start:1595 stop:1843 length:249 start_codon:yes stop_codon:yes gene_type:complete